MKIDFIQIGANVGNTNNDPVYSRVVNGLLSTGILIEANPNCFPFLRKNYEAYPNLVFENVAISNKEGTIKFHIDNIDKNGGTSQHASMSLDFQHSHLHKDEEITSIDVEAVTLESIFAKYHIEECNWLFVDTEGHDFDILINTNFANLNVKNIQFEHSHTDGPHRKGENYTKLSRYLEGFGYKLGDTSHEDSIFSK